MPIHGLHLACSGSSARIACQHVGRSRSAKTREAAWVTYTARLCLAMNQNDRDVMDSAMNWSQSFDVHLIPMNVTAAPIRDVRPSNVKERADRRIFICAITVPRQPSGICRNES